MAEALSTVEIQVNLQLLVTEVAQVLVVPQVMYLVVVQALVEHQVMVIEAI